ncbi:uncharacterized protein [Mytilus edulis]|uniref:uncharacterized protein n=1 Tax=Mytilus edulis TaxID=6550 RepID=UPI0039EEC34A
MFISDTDTTITSLALYRYMCQNIVGSENEVKTLRLMNTVRNNIESDMFQTVITSGSFGEGLEMRGSDLDIMYVKKIMEVFENVQNTNNSDFFYALMETDDVKPGFTQLVLYNIQLANCVVELNGKQYFSSTKFKQQILGKTDHVVHGPCVSDSEGNYDHAVCLHCTTWISQASQWIRRSNNSWPSYNVKQSILKHGVLFVPIGVKGSPKEDTEWRMSFSVGEKFLINTFTHTQLICYALLKILLKDVIETYTECEGLLCSYFLKTIIFWISEELPQSIWKPENLLNCFMRCFSRLIYSVDYSVCLHYFIPENNMFENKIEGSAREILLEKLNHLYSYGCRCILFSDQLSNFHDSMYNINIDQHNNAFGKVLKSKSLFVSNALIDNLYSKWNAYNTGIHQIVSCDKSSNKYIYVYYMSLAYASVVQSISLNNTKGNNKHQYTQYKSRLCTLLQNIHHDAVTGWLMLASLFYNSKQYSKALHIIAYSLSKYTPEKIHRIVDMSNIHYQLLKLKLFQKISVPQLWKIILVDLMKFTINSSLIPKELKMEVENGSYYISSIVYSYFLNILCHYQLNNARQCQDCLYTLQHVIEENYFIENSEQLHSKAYTILGTVFQLLGDSESARQAFMRSVEINPDERHNTSVKRMSLMSLV